MSSPVVIHPKPELLRQFVLGQMKSDESAKIEQHIIDCTQCCERLSKVTDDQFVDLLVEQRGTTYHSGEFETASASMLSSASIAGETHCEIDQTQPIGHVGNTSDRYLPGKEIARGGMGIVYEAFDRQLGRNVALKVVLPGGNTELRLRRFVNEARVTGQLQHPGVPAVYQLGRLPDLRPFIALKYVGGETLRKLLDAPSVDLDHMLDVFEQVCQTVGFAHTAHKTVHRDLKPENIMVGSHGEIQVMDWGIAKELGAHVGIDFSESYEVDEDLSGEFDLTAAEVNDATNVLDPFKSLSKLDSGVTRAGAVLGTPAYMPPEQAQGEVTEVDPRTDVFALGAILCEILTGKPPYHHALIQQVLVMAQSADLTETHLRLDQCTAPAELVELARRCLSPDKENRPADASEVAKAVTNYLRSTQQKLRQAELERAETAVRISEERKRRYVQLGLTGLLGLMIAVAASVFWSRHTRANQMAIIARSVIKDAEEKQLAARTAPVLSESLWLEAVTKANAAFATAKETEDEQLIASAKSLRTTIDREYCLAQNDLRLMAELHAILGDDTPRLREEVGKLLGIDFAQPGQDRKPQVPRITQQTRDPSLRLEPQVGGPQAGSRGNQLGARRPEIQRQGPRDRNFEGLGNRHRQPPTPNEMDACRIAATVKSFLEYKYVFDKKLAESRTSTAHGENDAPNIIQTFGEIENDFRRDTDPVDVLSFFKNPFSVSQKSISDFVRGVRTRPEQVKHRIIEALDVWFVLVVIQMGETNHQVNFEEGHSLDKQLAWLKAVLPKFDDVDATRYARDTGARDDMYGGIRSDIEDCLLSQQLQIGHDSVRQRLEDRATTIASHFENLKHVRTSAVWGIARALQTCVPGGRQINRPGDQILNQAEQEKRAALMPKIKRLLQVALSYHLSDYLLSKELAETLKHTDDGKVDESLMRFMVAVVSRDSTGQDRRLHNTIPRLLAAAGRYEEAIGAYYSLRKQKQSEGQGLPARPEDDFQNGIIPLRVMVGLTKLSRAVQGDRLREEKEQIAQIFRTASLAAENTVDGRMRGHLMPDVWGLDDFAVETWPDQLKQMADDVDRIGELVEEWHEDRAKTANWPANDQVVFASWYLLNKGEIEAAVPILKMACSNNSKHQIRAASACLARLSETRRRDQSDLLIDAAFKWIEHQVEEFEIFVPPRDRLMQLSNILDRALRSLRDVDAGESREEDFRELYDRITQLRAQNVGPPNGPR